MGFLKWLLYGSDPDPERLDRMAQARPPRVPLAKWAKHMSKVLHR